MADISSVVLVGRLSRESQIQYGQNGVAIVKFGIAVNKPRKNQDGTWEDDTSFFDCVYLGRGAESVNQYLEKGRQVAVQGELRQSKWTDKTTGKEQRRVEVLVNTLSLGQPSRSKDAQNGQFRANNDVNEQKQSFQKNNSYRNNNDLPQSQNQFSGGPEDFEDDTIPF